MHTLKRTIITFVVTGMLGSSPIIFASSTSEKPFAGAIIEGTIVLDNFPKEVQTGSIRINDDSEQKMVKQARIGSSNAAGIAIRAVPGTVLKTNLDDENGFLIWEVEILSSNGQASQLMIDAGNGRLLAVEVGAKKDREEEDEDEDEDKHMHWKFWEKTDKGKHRDRD